MRLGRAVKIAVLVLAVVVMVGVGVLWMMSEGKGHAYTYTGARDTYAVESRNGGATMVVFSNTAEDETYREYAAAYWEVEVVAAGMVGVMGWWVWRGRRKKNAPGFPVGNSGA